MDYHLKPVGKTCAATGHELVPGSVCHSVLVEREGKLVRLDFSPEGWSGPPEGTVAHWKCRVPEPQGDRPQPLDTEGLMRYFEQLVEDADPSQEKFCYVLALLLLQKKRLKLEGSRVEDDVEYIELSGKHGEGPYSVRDQQLSDEEIREVQEALTKQLTTEWS
ncbi:MAG TPA: hypothetical protein EYP14_17215 [Planctomycetaceae bacterium]|nr:hypothetical protein [Planctomycetaceae bacterium]